MRRDRARLHPTAARGGGRDRRRRRHRVRAVASARAVPHIARAAGSTRRVVGVRRATGAGDPGREGPRVRAAVRGARRGATPPRIEVAGIAFAQARAAFYAALLAGPGQRDARRRRARRLAGRDRPHDARRSARVPSVRRAAHHASHRGRRAAHRTGRKRRRHRRASPRCSPPNPTSPNGRTPRHLPGRAGHDPLRSRDLRLRAGRPVLHDLDLDVAGGSSVALVGASGAGKTTLAFLACRFYDPTAGRVFLDGVAGRRTPPRRARGAVSIVFEDTVVFTASIRDNLRVGRPDATDRDIERGREPRGGRHVHHALPERVRHRRRTAGLLAVRRPAPTARDRPRRSCATRGC